MCASRCGTPSHRLYIYLTAPQEPPKVHIEAPEETKKGKKEKDVLKAATQVVEEGDSDSDDDPMDEPADVTKDRKVRFGGASVCGSSRLSMTCRLCRGKYEYAILKKTKELAAVQERLYYVRWDKSRAAADMKREVEVRRLPPLAGPRHSQARQNLAKEYSRISTALQILLEKSQRTFEESLALGDIGLPASLDDREYKRAQSLEHVPDMPL